MRERSTVDSDIARALAHHAHVGQVTRIGEPVIDHVERVANGVPPEIRALAYLHDVLERSEARFREWCRRSLTLAEYSVLELLSRGPADPYESYVTRIAEARGQVGRIARIIKLADLNDHLQHGNSGNAPDYPGARDRIVSAQRRRREPTPPWAVDERSAIAQ